MCNSALPSRQCAIGPVSSPAPATMRSTNTITAASKSRRSKCTYTHKSNGGKAEQLAPSVKLPTKLERTVAKPSPAWAVTRCNAQVQLGQ